jgi:hypothetical protein
LESPNPSNTTMTSREETEDMNTKKDDGFGNDEEDDALDNAKTMVIRKMYDSINSWNIKWIL